MKSKFIHSCLQNGTPFQKVSFFFVQVFHVDRYVVLTLDL